MEYASKQTFIRWYDKYPNISLIIKISEDLPPWLQAEIGENLIQSITQYQVILEQADIPKSLGAEAVLSLYKSKRKMRWYDQIPQLHKALNMLITLPENAIFQLDAKYEEFAKTLNEQNVYGQASEA